MHLPSPWPIWRGWGSRGGGADGAEELGWPGWVLVLGGLEESDGDAWRAMDRIAGTGGAWSGGVGRRAPALGGGGAAGLMRLCHVGPFDQNYGWPAVGMENFFEVEGVEKAGGNAEGREEGNREAGASAIDGSYGRGLLLVGDTYGSGDLRWDSSAPAMTNGREWASLARHGFPG